MQHQPTKSRKYVRISSKLSSSSSSSVIYSSSPPAAVSSTVDHQQQQQQQLTSSLPAQQHQPQQHHQQWQQHQLVRFSWGDDDDGKWKQWPRNFTVVEMNRYLTSADLQDSIKGGIQIYKRRSKLYDWLHPKEEGSWSLAHSITGRSQTRDIAPWEDRRLLSEVMEQGPYEQKPIQGTNKKHFLLHLCWMPEAPSQPSPSKKRTGSKKTKKESPPAAPRTALTSKRSRAASGEHPQTPNGQVLRHED